MIAHNKEYLKIIIGSNNFTNYPKFVESCEQSQVIPCSETEFTLIAFPLRNKVIEGLILEDRVNYASDVLTKLSCGGCKTKRDIKLQTHTESRQPVELGKCNSCGGGKIR